ncbi:hypothetical protein M758_8G172400 [Ceratodon purpureus]|nr:hypothetical protein M758_8G172400 [Ceratodon purpureus]
MSTDNRSSEVKKNRAGNHSLVNIDRIFFSCVLWDIVDGWKICKWSISRISGVEVLRNWGFINRGTKCARDSSNVLAWQQTNLSLHTHLLIRELRQPRVISSELATTPDQKL